MSWKPKKCFYVKGSHTIIDTATDDGLSTCYGETLEQVQARYPGAELRDFNDALMAEITEAERSAFCHPPQEITEERFWYFLEVLPPVAWVRAGETESFKVSEFTCGQITQICCRIGNKYYGLSDDASLPHAEIVKRCLAA